MPFYYGPSNNSNLSLFIYYLLSEDHPMVICFIFKTRSSMNEISLLFIDDKVPLFYFLVLLLEYALVVYLLIIYYYVVSCYIGCIHHTDLYATQREPKVDPQSWIWYK